MASYRKFDPYALLEAFERKQTLLDSDYVADEVYMEKMERILTGPPYIGVPPDPSQICRNVFLGTSAHGENLDLLKRMRFTHVLNVDGFPLGLAAKRRERFKDTGITYHELPIDDSRDFDIGPYFSPAHTFIDSARMRGKVLIADSGINRGGAIALSYMVRSGTRLLQATKILKEERRVVLHHQKFLARVVAFARTMGMLDPDPDDVIAPSRYGRQIDRYRINSAHLPTII